VEQVNWKAYCEMLVQHAAGGDVELIREPAAREALAETDGGFNAKRRLGLVPQPVAISERCVAWPLAELKAVTRARVAGMPPEYIRLLVQGLHAQRTRGLPKVRAAAPRKSPAQPMRDPSPAKTKRRRPDATKSSEQVRLEQAKARYKLVRQDGGAA